MCLGINPARCEPPASPHGTSVSSMLHILFDYDVLMHQPLHVERSMRALIPQRAPFRHEAPDGKIGTAGGQKMDFKK